MNPISQIHHRLAQCLLNCSPLVVGAGAPALISTFLAAYSTSSDMLQPYELEDYKSKGGKYKYDDVKSCEKNKSRV